MQANRDWTAGKDDAIDKQREALLDALANFIHDHFGKLFWIFDRGRAGRNGCKPNSSTISATDMAQTSWSIGK